MSFNCQFHNNHGKFVFLSFILTIRTVHDLQVFYNYLTGSRMTYLKDSPNRIRLFNPKTTYFLGFGQSKGWFSTIFLFRFVHIMPTHFWSEFGQNRFCTLSALA